MELSPRAVVAGRYRADERLGAGAMGEVWGGVHVGIGTRVALKRLLPAGQRSHEQIARFKREAYLLARVQSDHVARVLDFIDDKQFGLVLVMELVDGTSLYDLLQTRPLSLPEALDVAIDLVTGVADLHGAQIIHRDLKPGNVILERRARGRPRARIVDFGMSREMAHGGGDDELTGITRAGVAMGTIQYMAPEQMMNSRGVTGSADIYAVGAMLYRAIAGEHAYTGHDDQNLARNKLMEEAPSLSVGADPLASGLSAVIARALRRKPAERFASAEEMLDALLELRREGEATMMLEDTTTQSHPPHPPPAEPTMEAVVEASGMREKPRTRATSFGWGVVLGMAVVVVGIAVVLMGRTAGEGIPVSTPGSMSISTVGIAPAPGSMSAPAAASASPASSTSSGAPTTGASAVASPVVVTATPARPRPAGKPFVPSAVSSEMGF